MVLTIGFRPDLNVILALILLVAAVALVLESLLRWVYRTVVHWPAM